MHGNLFIGQLKVGIFGETRWYCALEVDLFTASYHAINRQRGSGSSVCSSQSHECISPSSYCSCAPEAPECTSNQCLPREDEWHRSEANSMIHMGTRCKVQGAR